MPEIRSYVYEAMFLLGQAAAADLTGSLEHIREIFSRNKCEVLAMRKWDERRLAYEIAKQKRGIYLLTYFQAPAPSMASIERAFNLSDQVMRQLIVKVEHMTVDEMKAADGQRELETEAKLRASQPTPVAVAPEPAAEAVGAGDEE